MEQKKAPRIRLAESKFPLERPRNTASPRTSMRKRRYEPFVITADHKIGKSRRHDRDVGWNRSEGAGLRSLRRATCAWRTQSPGLQNFEGIKQRPKSAITGHVISRRGRAFAPRSSGARLRRCRGVQPATETVWRQKRNTRPVHRVPSTKGSRRCRL